MTAYTIEIRGSKVNIEVDTYYAPMSAKTWGPPEDCEPAYEGLIEWHAETGNELLDYYIDNAYDDHEEIEIAIEEKINEG